VGIIQQPYLTGAVLFLLHELNFREEIKVQPIEGKKLKRRGQMVGPDSSEVRLEL
jgi:hypothetical protein